VGFLQEARRQLFTPEEIDFSDAMKHLPNLPPYQFYCLSIVLSFFAISKNKIVATT
jgi:hypothetical protein